MIKLRFAKINPRQKSTGSQFAKLNPREMLKKWLAKINPRENFSLSGNSEKSAKLLGIINLFKITKCDTKILKNVGPHIWNYVP